MGRRAPLWEAAWLEGYDYDYSEHELLHKTGELMLTRAHDALFKLFPDKAGKPSAHVLLAITRARRG